MSLQAGTYRARAVEAELGLAGNGTERVAVLFEVTEEGPYQGERITWYGYFTDGAFARTVESLRHAGWQGDDLADLSTVGSRDCAIVVDWETYDGREYLRVKWVNAGGGGLALKTRMDDAAKRAFAARMRGQVVAAGGGARSAAPAARSLASAPRGSATAAPRRTAAPAAGAPPVDDSDIPF
jgi:hypothetical protein